MDVLRYLKSTIKFSVVDFDQVLSEQRENVRHCVEEKNLLLSDKLK